jgi:hypothetical protein
MLSDYESWRPIPEFPTYIINKEGDVRNVKTGRILAQSFNGCLFVSMTKDGKKYSRAVRRLLRKTFPKG